MASALPSVVLREFVTTERLGSGSYGHVYKAHRKTGAREVVAIKCVLKSTLSQPEIDNLMLEIKLLKTLKHEHIVPMVDFQWDAHYIYIIMEYCGGGDLSGFIKTRRSLPEAICRRFLQQLAQALQFLRSQNIAHMDLKPSNILLTSGRNPKLKLADFGLAQYLSPDQVKTNIRGSPLYMAPEMLLDRKYDAKVDIWSVGVILFECIFGQAPYKSGSVDLLLEKIKEERPIQIPTSREISPACRDLLERCLKRDPGERIDFEDFFKHEFLDFEHLPSESSRKKAVSLMARAVQMDRQDQLAEALDLYKEGLEYFVPLTTHESNPTRKETLRKKAEEYILRAEQIKEILHPSPSTLSAEHPRERPKRSDSQQRSSFDRNKLDELSKLCTVTPPLLTAVEIARSAEDYEREGRYVIALEKYKVALEMLLPLFPSEPKGERKILLRREISRWMKNAECIKDIIAVHRKVLAENGLSLEDKESLSMTEKQCIVQ